MIEIKGNKITHDGMVIGLLFDDEHFGGDDSSAVTVEPTIMLNLAWMKLAGAHIRVLGDPEVDRKRDGVVLER